MTRGPWSGISAGAEGRSLTFGDGKQEAGLIYVKDKGLKGQKFGVR